MRVKGYKTLPNACLRVLVQILHAYDRGQILTIRDIMRRLGKNYHGDVYEVLLRLQDAGLIEYQPGKGRTMTPRCTATFFLRPNEVKKMVERKEEE